MEGTILQILRTTKNDTGLFECISVTLGRYKHKLCLIILEKPVAEINFERKELYCNASDWSNMDVVFTWMHLSKFNEFIRHVNESEDGVMSFNTSSAKYWINGEYSCTVESSVNNKTDNLRAVSNAVTLELAGTPICIGNISERRYGKLEDTITLQKYVYGDFQYTDDINWLHPSKTLKKLSNKRFEITTKKTNITIHVYDNIIHLEVYSSNITIHRLQEEDFGTYTVNISGVDICFVRIDLIGSDVIEDQIISNTVIYVIIARVNSVALLIIIALLRLCLKPYFNSCGPTMTSENSHAMTQYEITQRPTTERIHLYEELELF